MVVTLSSWIIDSHLRSIVITCVLTGVFIGLVLSKYSFGFLRWLIERRDARRDKDELRRREEEKQRREEEAFAPFAGLLFDRKGNAYCPFHRTMLTACGSRSCGRTILYSGICPGCKMVIYANAPENEVNSFVDCLIEKEHDF